MIDYTSPEDYCQCPCHEPQSGAIHFMPCCETCPKCGQHINFDKMEHHLAWHEQQGETDETNVNYYL
jgi:hypothetical protein